MNFKISSIRKSDGKALYFFDDEVMEQYIKENGGEEAFEFNGFQPVPMGEEVIDPDSWRKDVLRLMECCGLDTKSLRKHEIDGTDNPDITEEEREALAKEIMDIKNRAAVYRINEDGTLTETGEDVEEVSKQLNTRKVERAIETLKRKAVEYGLDPEEIMGEGEDGERYNRLADAVWEKIKANNEETDEIIDFFEQRARELAGDDELEDLDDEDDN